MKKIDWKSKNTIITIIVLAIIIVPIIYNILNSLIAGIIAQRQASMPIEVQVSNPQEEEIYEEFETTGRIEAQYSINIIARIEGWLEKRYFNEGDYVKKGQKLFLIEPNEYVLEAKNAQARVNEDKAVYNNSQIELRRAKALIKEDFISQEDYDNAVAQRNRDKAALDGSVAQLNKAKLNLSYTTVLAPFNGRVGKIQITEGNYVTPSSGVLTTVYTTDPMKVTFTLKSSDFIRVKKSLTKSQQLEAHKTPIVVKLKLADGEIYDKTGQIEFVNNEIDETTGTVTLKALFDNPHEILVHGDYVNVILQCTYKTKVMLIPQSATKTDVGTGYYVWVVTKDGLTEKRNITVHNTYKNNWIVEDGLQYGDTVIVNGIQSIYQSGQKVKPIQYKPDETNTEGNKK